MPSGNLRRDLIKDQGFRACIQWKISGRKEIKATFFLSLH